MRSLYSAASGMAANQYKLDTISNNMANLNTTGYKTQDVQFKDMLYAQINQRPDVTALTGRVTGDGLAIGHGVLATGVSKAFTQGSLQETGQKLDVAIEGDGFFVIEPNDTAQGLEEMALTRDGSFKISVDEFGDNYLVASNGMAVHDMINDDRIVIGSDIRLDTVSINESGLVTAKDVEGESVELGRIGLVKIGDPNANLQAVGENLYRLVNGFNADQVTEDLTDLPTNERPMIKQGFLEQSNVDMTRQMTDMIVAQRAYSMNVRALQTADQMMGLANNLRG
ncbi:MAG TPA: flagellar hook-basal body protein [Bacilli bacterium]|nr:flagellar hook-basal body protein [Bacilli bacterium]